MLRLLWDDDEVEWYLSATESRALRMPEPDAYIGRTRGWKTETIDAWNAARPGRGVGGGRPRKRADG